MPKRTDALTETAGPVAEELAKRTGSLKVVLSAGVMVLSKLDPAAREKAIALANGEKDVELNIISVLDEKELARLWPIVEKIAKKVGVKIDRR